MRRIDINLDGTNLTTGPIQLNEGEEKILVDIHRNPNYKIAFYELRSANGHIAGNALTDGRFTRLSTDHFGELEINMPIIPEGSIRGCIYLGTWAEIMLVDLGLNLPGTYRSSIDQNHFQIGIGNHSHLDIHRDPHGNYHLNRYLGMQAGGIAHRADIVPANSPLTNTIANLHTSIIADQNQANWTIWRNAHIAILNNQTFVVLRNY
jgi:hypothetical protein